MINAINIKSKFKKVCLAVFLIKLSNFSKTELLVKLNVCRSNLYSREDNVFVVAKPYKVLVICNQF